MAWPSPLRVFRIAERGYAQRHDRLRAARYAGDPCERIFPAHAGGREDESHVNLAHAQRLGHQRCVLVGQIRILASESVGSGRMDDEQGSRPA